MSDVNGTLCHKCRMSISKDEVAITKRLVNRGTTTYYCAPCLADAFGITTEDIQRCIRHYKRMGCTLFQ